MGSLFGDVASTDRVARLLFGKSAGNPQLCTDLAQWLVTKKIVKYAGGMIAARRTTRRARQPAATVVGGLILEISAREAANMQFDLLEGVAAALYNRYANTADATIQ